MTRARKPKPPKPPPLWVPRGKSGEYARFVGEHEYVIFPTDGSSKVGPWNAALDGRVLREGPERLERVGRAAIERFVEEHSSKEEQNEEVTD